MVSDHFEELGRPPRLLHGGFGLLTVGNLRKPRWWAVSLADEQGDDVLASEVAGDGAQTLVESWATKHEDGTVDVLLWNVCPDATQFAGRPDLDRWVTVTVSGLGEGVYDGRLARVDNARSSIDVHVAPETIWPDDDEWQRLREVDTLHEEGLDVHLDENGQVTTIVDLPMPGIARLRLTPRG